VTETTQEPPKEQAHFEEMGTKPVPEVQTAFREYVDRCIELSECRKEVGDARKKLKEVMIEKNVPLATLQNRIAKIEDGEPEIIVEKIKGKKKKEEDADE